jgi:hypothetical protein
LWPSLRPRGGGHSLDDASGGAAHKQKLSGNPFEFAGVGAVSEARRCHEAAVRHRQELAETDSSPWLRIAAAQGGRPNLKQARPPSTSSDFRVLGDLEGVIDLDTEVSHGRLELGVPEEQLNGPQVLRAPVDQYCLGPAHRVRPVLGAVQAELIDPVPEDAGVLSGEPAPLD